MVKGKVCVIRGCREDRYICHKHHRSYMRDYYKNNYAKGICVSGPDYTYLIRAKKAG